jgi:hypothetical protein
MNRKVLTLVLLLALPRLLRADNTWTLVQSTLTYHISHPLHEADGTSHAARGKGICSAGLCNFLVAVPVKTFDSGNSNRDLHMLEVVRGGEFPMVIVRFELPESALASPTVHANLEVQFAGQIAEYTQVPFQLVAKGTETQVTGTIGLKLSDFKITPPSLLAMPVKNEVPVRVETIWRRP